MNNINKVQLNDLGFNFIDSPYIPEGKDEFYLRFKQSSENIYRFLTSEEIIILKSKGNSADNWNNIRVTENFSPNRIKNSNFYGLIRIGDIDDIYLDFHDLHQPVGIYDSTIVSCDIGSNVAISNVNYLSHYIIRDNSILININEMITTNYAKFGNGIIKEGESESVRIKLEICNENGNRSVLPFNGMLPADAYLWSKYRNEQNLMDILKEITQRQFDNHRGYYGVVDECTVIKNCRIIKDTNIGSHAYIKGCNKLKNLTINSNSESSTQLGEGIELVNGIVGFGCRIFYGVKAIRFILSDYSTLKYGARLINSYLGSNSTISCCEVLNSLIYPGHEQHHNNSFLCAATIKGQSNIASGATIGSNHNSRANDGEIVAERGFWPGLCTSLKHNCKFSTFNLLAKGSYPAEINNPYPFSLISNNETKGELVVLPAYWFMYNLYALARNSWKYAERDNRINKKLNVEFDYLAPDTINEMITAMELMLNITKGNDTYLKSKLKDPLEFFKENPDIDIITDTIEHSKRPTRIVKVGKAYFMYENFVLFYSVKTILNYCHNTKKNMKDILSSYKKPLSIKWHNIGGQLINDVDLKILKDKIENSEFSSWDDIHQFYIELSDHYESDKLNHAIYCYHKIIKKEVSRDLKKTFQDITTYISEETYNSRKKDYTNTFKLSTYDSREEMESVIGKLDENSFIKVIKNETKRLKELSELYL
jgi:hypothetical protein